MSFVSGDSSGFSPVIFFRYSRLQICATWMGWKFTFGIPAQAFLIEFYWEIREYGASGPFFRSAVFLDQCEKREAPSDDVLVNVDMEADLQRSWHLERKAPTKCGRIHLTLEVVFFFFFRHFSL